MQPIDEKTYKRFIDDTLLELKGLNIPNLKIIDDPSDFWHSRKSFVTTDYSLADFFRINIKEYNLAPDYQNLEWQIQFFFIPLLSDKDTIVEVYCQHKEWGNDFMHLAIEEQGYIIESNKQVLGETYHPETLDNIVSFYTKQGVKPILLNKMEKSVQEIRLEKPIK